MDLFSGWDGTYNGMKSPDGTYTWKMILKAADNALEQVPKDVYVGHVNLIR